MKESDRIWPNVIVGRPFGYCVGVARAVEAYESFVDAHQKGTVYSVGEPAHNPILVEGFKQKGVVFKKNISEVPPGSNVIFGPHGHTNQDVVQAEVLANEYLLTECPYVTSVKKEISTNTSQGIITIYYGQKDSEGNLHPETRAALSAGDTLLVTSMENLLDEIAGKIKDPKKVAFACQTTHNLEKVLVMSDVLKGIFPEIKMRLKTNLCLATTNRQKAARAVIASFAETVVVVGDSETSSNTKSLAKEALNNGAKVFTVNTESELNAKDFFDTQIVGIVGSASAMQQQLDGVINFFVDKGSEKTEITVADESIIRLPNPRVYKPQASLL
jgi:4-hydroxy-3-methylbut-2-enyl diphosphate reductase